MFPASPRISMGLTLVLVCIAYTCRVCCADIHDGVTAEADNTSVSAMAATTSVVQYSMDDLFAIGFNDEDHELGEECFDRIWELGIGEDLDFFDQICVCFLECDDIRELTPVDEARRDKYRMERALEAERVRLERRYNEFLPQTIGVSTIYLAILVAGVFGNSLVLVTVAKYMGRLSVTNVLICSISAGDLLIMLVVVPFRLAHQLHGTWRGGDALCRITGILFYASFCGSAFSLLAMSIERYIVICHPMKAQVVSTVSRARRSVAAIWMSSLAIGGVIGWLAAAKHLQCSLQYTWGRAVFIYTTCLAVGVFLIPTLIMAWAYIQISITLWKSIKIAKSMRGGGEGGDNEKKEGADEDANGRIKVIKMLIMVVVVFAFCWGPFWLFRVVETYGYKFPFKAVPQQQLTLSLQSLTYFNSAINPILYAFASRPFRLGFMRCFRPCFRARLEAHEKSVTSKTFSTGISSKAAASVST